MSGENTSQEAQRNEIKSILDQHKVVVAVIDRVKEFKIARGHQSDAAEDAMVKLVGVYQKVNPIFIYPQPGLLGEIESISHAAYIKYRDHFEDPVPLEGRLITEDGQMQLSRELGGLCRRAADVFEPFIAMTEAMNSAARAGKAEVQSVVAQASAEWDAKVSELNKNIAKVGVAKYAEFFQKQADAHGVSMQRWLAASAFAAVALAALLFASFFFLDFADKDVAIQFAVTKALLFSTLAYVLFFCVRNYMAHRHNHIVNKHRQNALLTYRAILSATEPGGRAHDIVLTQAAHCIFAPQSTGYTKDGGEKMNTIPVDTGKR